MHVGNWGGGGVVWSAIEYFYDKCGAQNTVGNPLKTENKCCLAFEKDFQVILIFRHCFSL